MIIPSTSTGILQDTFDVVKIIAIPLIGFFLYNFYNEVKALRKSVDKLIVQHATKETYCYKEHEEISEHFHRNDNEIEKLNNTVGSHGQWIARAGDKLNIKL